MKPESTRTSSRLLWQAGLLGLPIVILVYVGLTSLRQDRILARAEATERAQTIADEIVQRLWTVITATPPELKGIDNGSLWLPQPGEPVPPGAFAVDQDSALLFPPPRPSLFVTPLLASVASNMPPDSAFVRAQQLEMAALSDNADATAAINAYQEFLTSSPPPAVAAPAHYSLGLLMAKAGQTDAAAEYFRTIITRYPTAAAPSGVTLATLSQLKLIELAPRLSTLDRPALSALIEGLSSNLVYRPTPLSLHLLERATLLDQAFRRPTPVTRSAGIVALPGSNNPETLTDRWMKTWIEHEQARRLFTLAQPLLLESTAQVSSESPAPNLIRHRFPRLFWLSDSQPGGTTSDDATEWLAVRAQTTERGAWYVTRPLSLEDRGQIQGLQRLAGGESQNSWMMVSFSANGAPSAAPTNQPITNPIFTALEEPLRRLPRYFGVSVELAGRPLISSNTLAAISLVTTGKGSGQAWKVTAPIRSPEVLAVADTFADGIQSLRVIVHLVSPALLFARQQARTTMFGSLIGLSLLAASVGFVSTYRALQRQERLAALKTNFVSSVSHELRAPIASVRLMAEGLERGRVTDDTKRAEYCRFIVQECRRLSGLIENVLDFSRIEQGRKQYELEPTDLVSLVGETLGAWEPQASQRQIHLQQKMSGTPVTVEADGRAIQQALINLVDNAIKHSPAESTVTVGLDFPDSSVRNATDSNRARALTPEPAVVQVWVEDQGTGIPPEEHERIFERFYRLGSELRRETQGVGIGLSIVKHIVEAHGGEVTVRSAPGAGSRFAFSLRVLPATGSPPQT